MTEDAAARRDPNISQLIAATLATELDHDPKVLLLGEDVAEGGARSAPAEIRSGGSASGASVTPPSRRWSSPGMAVGLAMSGWRPVVEVMFVDFVDVFLEQIYNAAAKNHYMSGGQARMPITIRTASTGGLGSPPQLAVPVGHARPPAGEPKVVAPGNRADYRGLLTAAIDRSRSPSCSWSTRTCTCGRQTRSLSAPSSSRAGRYAVEIGTAAVVRSGTDVSVATLSTMVEHTLAAAELLAAEGSRRGGDRPAYGPRPPRWTTRRSSPRLSRTNRLLVVDEDYRSFGLSGEIVRRPRGRGGGALGAAGGGAAGPTSTSPSPRHCPWRTR